MNRRTKERPTMSVKVVISLEVADFATFKSVFEQSASHREEAGITESGAYQNMDSPNNVWVIGIVTSKEAFWAFMTSDAQKERMKTAGVVSPPTVTLLEA
jgi:hypothetical protein